jgi:hypothetical protein
MIPMSTLGFPLKIGPPNTILTPRNTEGESSTESQDWDALTSRPPREARKRDRGEEARCCKIQSGDTIAKGGRGPRRTS